MVVVGGLRVEEPERQRGASGGPMEVEGGWQEADQRQHKALGGGPVVEEVQVAGCETHASFPACFRDTYSALFFQAETRYEDRSTAMQ